MDGPIKFGRFLLDTELGILRDATNADIVVGRRQIAILSTLIAAGGAPVTKEMLVKAGWRGAAVEDSNLTVQVAALRKTLGRRPDGGEWIVTIPRIGYRIDLSSLEAPPTDAPWPKLAVYPFENIGNDAENGYFAAGVVEELVATLSRFRSFLVITRTGSPTAPPPEDAGQSAAREYRLSGSVRRAGERLRISAKLVDCQTQHPLWTRTFDGEVNDVFDFQRRITEGVATLIEPRIQANEIELSRRRRAGSSITVYDTYLQALSKISSETERDNAEAYALLARAMQTEPANPHLVSHAAWALEHRLAMGWPSLTQDDRTQCIALAHRGLELAGGDAMLMAHCGMALLQVAREYDLALEVLRTALELNPNNLLVTARAGVAELHCGDIDKAFVLLARATNFSAGDKGAHFASCGMAHLHMVRGDFEEARTWATKALARNQHFDASIWILIAANAHSGRTHEAKRHLQAYRQRIPGVTLTLIREGQPAKFPQRIEVILSGLREAGMPES